MKTKEQTNEMAVFLPIGMIIIVHSDFTNDTYLDLNGQFVDKKDYPELAEILKGTVFDSGDRLELIHQDSFLQAPGVNVTTKIAGTKLVMKAK